MAKSTIPAEPVTFTESRPYREITVTHLRPGQFVQRITSTKGLRIYGPATVILEKHVDGGFRQLEMDYSPKATLDELYAMWNERAERRARPRK